MTLRQALASALALLYLLRLAELTWFNSRKKKGDVKFAWTTAALILSGTLVYLGSALEALLWRFEILWPVTTAGASLCLLRAALKFWSVRTLGQAWSAFIEVRQGQSLVRQGPYRFVRHPVYLSALLEVLSIPMIANAPVALGYALLVHWSLTFVRAWAEEATLRSQFGADYDEYARQVPAFLPRIL